MNRFDRITALLIQLQSKKVVKAQDLADRFEISLRTVYRDIRTLEEAGVPIYGEAGVGYSIMEGYRLPPVLFTREEATALVAAEKMMENFTDSATQKNFQSFLYKVKSVLNSNEKDMVESLEDQILIRKRKKPAAGPENALDIILKSISSKSAIRIQYKAFGKEALTDRVVEPIGVYHEEENWYTVGFCQLRLEYRNFRVDRMESIEMLNTKQTAERISFSDYQKLNNEFPDACEKVKVILQVDVKIARFLSNRKQFYGFVSERNLGETVEMTFETTYLNDAFARWLLMFADYATIIEPLSLKDRMMEIIRQIEEKHQLEKSY